MTSTELESIYQQRFNSHISYRNRVWRVLVSDFFSNFVNGQTAILDLGCGYGEFINHVACRAKYAMDLNSRTKEYLNEDITFFEQDCSLVWPCPDNSLDAVFTSNFFEHLESKQALEGALAQAFRCLRPGGRLIAMGPNIRFVGGAYWDFWDHHLALTESSLAEVLRMQGFRIERTIDRFLPYTMAHSRKIPSKFVSIYLKLPFMWKLLGKQFVVTAKKPLDLSVADSPVRAA